MANILVIVCLILAVIAGAAAAARHVQFGRWLAAAVALIALALLIPHLS